MDIKHILEKLSEIDTKHTLLESAPVAKVLVESTVAEPKRTSIYDVLVSELMAEADYTLPKGKFPNAVTQGNAPAAEPGAGIANPPPNLNVAPPAALTPTSNITAPANAPAAPAAGAKPGFADRVKAGFQQQAEKNAQYNKEMAAAGSPEAKAEWAQKLTPSQLKWLGGADASDPAIRARMPKPLPGETTPAANTAANAQAQQADMDASSQGATPASDLAKANAQDQQADMDASSQPVATTLPVAEPAPAQVTTTSPAKPAAADPAAPAVTANPNATPAVTPAKTPYKGSAGAQEIQKLNPAIKDVNKIQVGQTLKMPDGSTYTVKPGDTLDRIAKGGKPAGEEATKMPPTTQQDRIDKAPPAAPAPAAKPAPAAPAPFRKELDVDRIKQLSGAPAKPGKLDLSVNNPAMNPASVAPTKESIRNEDDAILERIRSALKF
jgi:LysM repeat protein